MEAQNTPTEAEKRCKFGGPVREGKRPVKDEPERPPKELPLLRTKLPSRDGNSSLSSDVKRWLAAKVCTQYRHKADSCTHHTSVACCLND